MARKKKRTTDVDIAAPSVDKDWQARSDLDTLSRAQEIIKSSPRFTAAKSEAKRQTESLKRIARLEGKRL